MKNRLRDEKLPRIATLNSCKVFVEKGREYAWCSCGLSSNQPFCDGSHVGTGFEPQIYVADETKIAGFCGCKYSKKGAICDGEHKYLVVEPVQD